MASTSAAAHRVLSSLILPRAAIRTIPSAVKVAGRRRLIHTTPSLFNSSPSPKSDPLYTPTHPSLRPTPTSALSALCSRIGLEPTPALLQNLEKCLIDQSWIKAGGADSITRHLPKGVPKPSTQPPTTQGDALAESNVLLNNVGNALLGLFASEHLATSYPFFPTRALKAAVSAYVGPAALLSVGRELGVGVSGFGQGVGAGLDVKNGGRTRRGQVDEVAGGLAVKWSREYGADVLEGEERGRGLKRQNRYEDVVAGAIRSFVGLIYQEQGMTAAREFVHGHILSRHLDLTEVLNFRDPKMVLAQEVRRMVGGKGEQLAVESRILAESGRTTQSPIFNIGLFLPSGLKLGEGHGSSLKMAEHRAATNALLSIYTTRGERLAEAELELSGSEGLGQSVWGIELPTSLHGKGAEEEAAFLPSVALLGKGEAHYASRDPASPKNLKAPRQVAVVKSEEGSSIEV